ncbi:MAG TPA: hypothetical protein ENK33_10325 [Desulfobacterales bacterium]|nr:hypothetical protein [Desulfobacterales bacterium]
MTQETQKTIPEVTLEICSGFFRIPTKDIVYNIKVISADTPSTTKVIEKIIEVEKAPAPPQPEPAVTAQPPPPLPLHRRLLQRQRRYPPLTKMITTNRCSPASAMN